MESKTFRHLDKFVGTTGSWREWSFNFLTTLGGTSEPAVNALKEVLKVSAAPLTKDLLGKAVPGEVNARHSSELFMVLCELTGGGSELLG